MSEVVLAQSQKLCFAKSEIRGQKSDGVARICGVADNDFGML